jgi:hypothetical protein
MKGIFRGKARSWGLGESKSGKEQVGVEFEILTPDAEFKTLTWYGYFTEKTLDRTIESLRIMGWTGNDLEQLSGLDTNEVDLVVDEEEYEGKLHTKVQWVNRVGGLQIKAPLSPEKTRSFAAAMKDRIKAIDAAGGLRAKPAKSPVIPPEPPPLTDDDLHF